MTSSENNHRPPTGEKPQHQGREKRLWNEASADEGREEGAGDRDAREREDLLGSRERSLHGFFFHG